MLAALTKLNIRAQIDDWHKYCSPEGSSIPASKASKKRREAGAEIAADCRSDDGSGWLGSLLASPI
ncbi:MAG: hypothetical protein AAGB13_15610, partial [Cyanobacteria bacterium P01_F01_bin.33]